MTRLVIAVGLGASTGAAVVGWGLYRQAEVDVEERLTGAVWSESGQVLSAPMELWPGLAITPEELASDLQAAGYARVARAEQPGDFQVAPNDVLVMVPANETSFWKVPGGEVHVAFKGGRVSAISPRRTARFAPMELAGIRGPDNESRNPVTLASLPAHVPQALLAMEDSRFYQHEGLDPLGIARAILVNVVSDGPMQGGSTLSQQLVKNLLLTQERTWERKSREALLAIAIEQNRTKDEILELYLNEIYLGQAAGASVCGLDQAARVYFGKSATRLTVGEAATLAGIVSAPNRYSPLRHPEAARARRDLALGRMAELGFIEQQAADREMATKLVTHPSAGRRRAPWVVDAAMDVVEGISGEGSVAARGVTVHTTLQPALQRIAERAVAEGAKELAERFPNAAKAEIALVAVRVSDGAIVAMVGGRDYGRSQFNRAISGKRQLGSTIKPLTYLMAFDRDRGLSPATLVKDEEIERRVGGKTWTPKNYDGRYLGDVTIRRALASSRNVPAVLMAEEVGMKTLQAEWRKLGLSGATALPSAALGAFEATPTEVAAAYTVFPGRGQWARPSVLRAAVAKDGDKLVVEQPMRLPRASPRAAFLATRLLEAVVDEGTGRRAARYGVNGAVGGKTGTTDDERDAWFAGVTPALAVAVWVGHDRGQNLGLTGAEAALPIWSRFVAGSGTQGGRFSPPDDVESAELCTADHLPVDPDDPCEQQYTAYFSAGTVPAVPRNRGEGAGDDEPSLLSRTWDQLRSSVGAESEVPDRRTERRKRRSERRNRGN